MRALTLFLFLLLSMTVCHAQTGNSFVTSDRINRAPAMTLHCAGTGNIAVPCGNTGQPVFVTGTAPLATAGNQAAEISSDQAVATALGTPQDQPYTNGAGTTVAILKGVFTALSTGITSSPAGGTFVSRSVALAASQGAVVFPINAARRYIAFQAPPSVAIWVNFLGGTATPNGADCVQFAPGTFYESGQFVARGAISIYSPTAISIAAWEG